MGKIKRALPFAAAVLLLLLTAGCGGDAVSYIEKQFFAMNTYMILRADGENAAEAIAQAEQTIYALETELEVRVTSPTGAMSQLNAAEGQPVPLDAELIALLQAALDASAETDGAFDITTYPLSLLWNFTGEGHVPTEQELSEALAKVGADRLILDAQTGTAQLLGGAQIDLGAIAKGYAADTLAKDLKAAEIESALLNLGGNVLAIGSREDGEAWRVAVADPADTAEVVGVLSIRSKAVVTSGTYERYFMEGAVRYHHLLDPATGKPAQNGLASVTVVCDSATRADILSTALFVMGEEKAIEFWKNDGGFEMILIRDDGTIKITAPLRTQFEETAGTGYKIKIIE